MVFMDSMKTLFFVLGGGISGNSALNLLKRNGYPVNLVDSIRGIPDSIDTAELYLHPGTCIVKSPGILPNHPWLETAKRRGIPVLSEIDLGFEFLPSKPPHRETIGITGTNGKSTTTVLTHKILTTSFPEKQIAVGGNLGRPFTDFCTENWEIAVLELSSYQLEDSRKNLCKISAFLNLAPDHLERHKTMENYACAKSRIAYENESSAVLVIRNDTLPIVQPYLKHFIGKIYVFGISCTESLTEDPRICGYGEILPEIHRIRTLRAEYETLQFRLPGNPNLENLTAAILLAEALDCEPERIQEGYKEFRGLPHRFEEIHRIGNWRFINDSKATNLHSVLSWLQSYSPRSGNLHLLIGGKPKEESPSSLIETLKEKGAEIYLFGEAGKIWKPDFRIFHKTCHFLETIEEALILIKAAFRKHPDLPSLVVLSPGCASFDQFRNFEERGEHFRSLVKELFAS